MLIFLFPPLLLIVTFETWRLLMRKPVKRYPSGSSFHLPSCLLHLQFNPVMNSPVIYVSYHAIYAVEYVLFNPYHTIYVSASICCLVDYSLDAWG
uniref:Uncharacterized protein n=1 Tax=Oryza brachyantha TaxID=4533 RepID=J3NBX6_ORYBR